MKKINIKVAYLGATLLGSVALITLYHLATPLAAFLAFGGHFFYVCFYTLYLKYKTPQNIVIGGAAGAVGPLIGWASVTNSLSVSSCLLFLIIFLWTPPHFWALSLKYKKDYAKAGIPMFPVIYGDQKTRKNIFLYTLSLIPTLIFFYYFEKSNLIFILSSLALTLYFIYLALRLYLSQNNKRAMPLFHYSCLYAFGIFGILTLDRLYFLLNKAIL